MWEPGPVFPDARPGRRRYLRLYLHDAAETLTASETRRVTGERGIAIAAQAAGCTGKFWLGYVIQHLGAAPRLCPNGNGGQAERRAKEQVAAAKRPWFPGEYHSSKRRSEKYTSACRKPRDAVLGAGIIKGRDTPLPYLIRSGLGKASRRLAFDAGNAKEPRQSRQTRPSKALLRRPARAPRD